MASKGPSTVNLGNGEPEIEGDAAVIPSASLALIDESQWVEQLRQQKCMQNSEAKLKNRIEKFVALATESEQNELQESRNQLWALMSAAKKKDELKNPDYNTTPMPTSQRFKEHYNSFLQSGYELSKHLDLFVDQAPEYVSLAWGAIKILMVVQISNQELKESVHSHLRLIARKFDLVDHLPDFMPQKNLITAVSEAYGLFSKFLAKAIKYYSECRALRYLKAFTSPWKIRFQELVDEIDGAFNYINDITQARSFITAEANLAISGQILQVDNKMWNVIQRLPEQIQKLEDKLKTVHFEKAVDIYQTTSMLQQRLEERISEPSTASRLAGAHEGGNKDFSDILDIFTELRDLEAEREHAKETEFISETTEQKTKRRNILKSDEIVSWVESSESQLLWIDGSYVLSRSHFLASFVTPLTIDAACNYESVTILKHFCGSFSSTRNSCLALVQVLVAQLIKQYPQLIGEGDSKLSRSKLAQAAKDFTKLWEVFANCLSEKNHSSLNRVYIIIDSIDELAIDNQHDYELLMLRLNQLTRQEELFVKILLSSRVLPMAPVASDISDSLSVPTRKWSLVPFEENLPSLQSKFSEIQEGRCKRISFPQLMLLYPPRTIIYTKTDSHYRAYVVSEISVAMETMPGRFDPLHLRVWSVDHNGTYFTKRYSDLSITQFSGNREVTDLRYIPAGYLPEEARVRNSMIERGRRYWKLGEKPHFCHGDAHVMVDQSYRTLREIPQQELDDQFQKTHSGDLKAMILILCPHILCAYDINNLKWIEVEVISLREVHPTNELDHFEWKEECKASLKANISAHINHAGRSQSKTRDIVESKRPGLIMLFYGPAGTGKTTIIEYTCSYFGLPLLVINVGTLVDSPNMDAQLQEYMDLALRWTAVLYLKKAHQLFNASSSSRLSSSEATLFHKLSWFRGIAALSVDKLNRSWTEFTKFVPKFRMIFETEDLNKKQMRTIWTQFLDQIEPNKLCNRENIEREIQSFQQDGGNSVNTRAGIANVMHGIMAKVEMSGEKITARDFVEGFEQAGNFWTTHYYS